MSRLSVVSLTGILAWGSWVCHASSEEHPHLSIRFFDPDNGRLVEPIDDRVSTNRNERIHFNVQLVVESVEARYEGLVFRDSSVPDPLLGGIKRPQNLWISTFRLDDAGDRRKVPILTHCSGGGKSLRTYHSSISLHILYFEPQRSKRVERMIDRSMKIADDSNSNEPDQLTRQRENWRRQVYRHMIDMPPGDYELEVVYAPYAPGSWQGKLTATAQIRISSDGDPLTTDGSDQQDH